MDNDHFEAVATRVSIVSITVNLLLSGFKFLAGALGHSGAMLSDAVHSLSDVLGSLIVIIGVKLSARASDEDHPYGHERMENVASLILSGILAAAGIAIGKQALTAIIDGSFRTAAAPGKPGRPVSAPSGRPKRSGGKRRSTPSASPWITSARFSKPTVCRFSRIIMSWARWKRPC